MLRLRSGLWTLVAVMSIATIVYWIVKPVDDTPIEVERRMSIQSFMDETYGKGTERFNDDPNTPAKSDQNSDSNIQKGSKESSMIDANVDDLP
ncbi:MAG: hypothetical protein HOI66_13325 [Verrucomicrobia bacterium]|jgi:hypothetical protein|nr:hypothetical protein [Verrucomicrobiota bacterium]